MNRRVFLSAFFPTMAAAYERFHELEPTWFELTRTRISLPGVRPTRVLHISDIHISDGMTAPELAVGFEAGLAQRPDLICLTGDFVSVTTGFDRPGLERLLRRAAATAPTYAVLGNHDSSGHSTQVMRDLVASTGVHLLHNRSAAEHGLVLVGVGDYWSKEFEPRRAFAGVDPAAPTLLLCHNPDAKYAVRAHSWNLMLSGHTHGGQARIPGLNPLWTPVWDKRFVAGLYTWNNRHLFITRGLGSPKHVRAFCRPEVSILELG
jgi:predicted MPP superfamily phosphohydrolase